MKVLSKWDGESLISQFDRETGAWFFIAIHSSKAGPATGGTRMLAYNSPEDGLLDALKLAQGMTLKFAVAGFSRGGGKGVIALPKQYNKEMKFGLLERYGSLIKSLKGLYYTGPDVGTNSNDMDIIDTKANPYVHCTTYSKAQSHDSGYFTAYGIFQAMRGTLEYLYGSDNFTGKKICVQGAGSVGLHLIKMLTKENASVMASDTQELRKKQITEAGVILIEPSNIYSIPCDIYSPCALGGVLNMEIISQLQCKAIVGAANNQLKSSQIAHKLMEKGILYAPDFAVNFGGALAITGIEANNWSIEAALGELRKINEFVQLIYNKSLFEKKDTVQTTLELSGLLTTRKLYDF